MATTTEAPAPPVSVQVEAPAAPAAADGAAPMPATVWPTSPPGVPVIREGDAFILDINGDRQALMRARKDG